MQFVPYTDLENTPHIVVDGAASSSCVLNLSHWPHSGTPKALKGDLSAQIAFHYILHPEWHVDADIITNDHFDEDGLVSLLTLLSPDYALSRQDILIDIASAGDFGCYRSREAARISFALSSYSKSESSPLDADLFNLPYPEQSGRLYQELLSILPDMIEEPEKYRRFWEAEDEFLQASEDALAQGLIKLEEFPELDLALLTIPENWPAQNAFCIAQTQHAPCHPMAVNNITNCFRILWMQGRKYSLQYRYESWVQLVSKRPLSRVDLAPLAEALTKSEPSGTIWAFDGVKRITPSLRMINGDESGIDPPLFLSKVQTFLKSAPPAWNPYD